MLERIREGAQSPWAIGVVGLIILSFVVTGVGSYLGSTTGNVVVTVNGEEITEQALETAYRNERNRMESQFGEAISSMFANPESLAEFRANILDRLINEKLVEQKAFELGLRVGDEEIKQAIIQMPEFQLAGQFDNDTYLAVLRQAGLQPTQFRDLMRSQMTSQQLSQAVMGSAFALPNEVEYLLTLQQQTRDASIIEIQIDQFKEKIELTDEEIQAYYDLNIDRFETNEQVKLAYVDVDVNDLMAEQEVTDEEALSFYQESLIRYQTEEERRVSHILIEFGDDKDIAFEQTQDVLLRVISGDETFADIARSESADIVSAEAGGDLDFISIGMMDIAFENAAFALQTVGDISEVVETEFGFHIIKLTDIKESVTTAFEEVQEEIIDTLKREKATDLFFEYQEQMAALAFEVPDTLEDVAQAINETVFETPFFERGQLPPAVNYPQVEGIAFSPELVQDQVNSDLLEINNEKVMVVRVADYNPQRTLSLEEVRAGIESQLTQDKAQEMAVNWALELKQSLENGASIEEELATNNLTWQTLDSVARTNTQTDIEVTTALFGLSPVPSENVDVVTMANSNIALIKLNSVTDNSDFSQEDIESNQNNYAMSNSRKLTLNLVNALKEEATIITPTD